MSSNDLSTKNKYFGLRHGESIPNTKGVITSVPKSGLDVENGLSEKGKQQAASVELKPLIDAIHSSKGLAVFCSDFSRANQTANIVFDRLKQESKTDNSIHLLFDKVQLREELRERDFGDFEGTSNKNYDLVWANDEAHGENQTLHNAESTASVGKRLRSLISEIDSKFENCVVLFVSHGDTMQILQCLFANKTPALHRKMPHLSLCELRGFN